MRKIFLDLDGVLVWFVKGAAPLFGLTLEEMLSRCPAGTYDMDVGLGVSRTQFFATISKAGEDFWANLEPYPHALEFYEHCKSIAPTKILTSSTFDPHCAAGKMRWMYKWLGTNFRDYHITPLKEDCASPGAVLIDDLESNVNNFRAAGGKAILWPTHFNCRYAETNAVEVVKKELQLLT